MQDYPNCIVNSPSLVGDGTCDGGDYNTAECGFDGGDCEDFNNKYPNCNVAFPYLIGDGLCDGGDYNTAECGFDGGDCEDFNAKYPDCTVSYPPLVGDGYCDDGDYKTFECGFDGGDCTSGTSTENSFPVWSVIGGAAGAFLFIAIGIVICKKKRNTSMMQQEIAGGGGGGVQAGNARVQGSNQSIADNGAPSPSAPTQNETREQKQHNRRFKILTSILQKVRFCQQQ
jgi:hypothetical protein